MEERSSPSPAVHPRARPGDGVEISRIKAVRRARFKSYPALVVIFLFVVFKFCIKRVDTNTLKLFPQTCNLPKPVFVLSTLWQLD